MSYGAVGGREKERLVAAESGRECESGEKDTPQQWQPLLCLGRGAGQLEYQGYATWTQEEQKNHRDGKLDAKWGIGQVSIRLPLDGPVPVLALLWSFLPYVVPIWWLVWMALSTVELGKPDFFPTYGVCVAVSSAVVNETVTKVICRKLFSTEVTSRPPEAVCKHPGMPSGHVLNGWTLMVWCILEEVLDNIGHPVLWVLITVAVMAPVPWARVYNRDHTEKQVLVSVVASLLMGFIAFLTRKHFFPKHTIPV